MERSAATVLVELRQTADGERTVLRVEEAGEPLASAIEVAGGGRDGVELKLSEGALLTIEGRPVEASALVVSAQRFEGGAASALAFEAELVRGAGTGSDDPVRLAETGGITEFRTSGEWTLRISRTDPRVERS